MGEQSINPIDVRNAEFQSMGNDLYWKVYDMEDGFIRWTGYDDGNWWRNVAPARRDKVGEKTGRTYRINYETNVVEVFQ